MEPRITLITLGVSDLERSLRFYRDGLGWPLSGASVPGEVAFFHTGGATLGLYPQQLLTRDANLPDTPPAFGGIALAHNVRGKAEVDEALALAATIGGKVLKRGEDTPWGGYVGYFADPDGHVWEVTWNPGFPLRPDGSLTLPE